MAGIDKTLETISDVKAVAVDAIGLVKVIGGGVFAWPSILAQGLKIAADVKELVTDAPAALPELTDIDSAEAGKIGTAAYDLVKAIVTAISAK